VSADEPLQLTSQNLSLDRYGGTFLAMIGINAADAGVVPP